MPDDALTGTKEVDSKIVNEGNRTVLLFYERYLQLSIVNKPG